MIEKIPTPIKPVELDKKKHNISRAYFEKKSSVDYIGVAQGIPICFDAKETRQKSLPLKNIHEHQINFMESFEKQQGISFHLPPEYAQSPACALLPIALPLYALLLP